MTLKLLRYRYRYRMQYLGQVFDEETSVNNAYAVFKNQLNNVYCPFYVRPQLDFAGALYVSFFINCHSSVFLSGPQKGDCTFEYAYSFFIFLFLPLFLWFPEGLTDSKGNFLRKLHYVLVLISDRE
jgi:hypothetical protein